MLTKQSVFDDLDLRCALVAEPAATVHAVLLSVHLDSAITVSSVAHVRSAQVLSAFRLVAERVAVARTLGVVALRASVYSYDVT